MPSHGNVTMPRLALERARSLDMVIFDKTGTLTRGSPAVSEVAAAPGTSEDKLVAYSAAVESNSEHPLAKAILAEAGHRNLTQLPATNFEALSGRGARALVKGKSIAVGGPRMLTEANVTVPPAVEKLTTAWASDGKTVLYAVADDQLLGFRGQHWVAASGRSVSRRPLALTASRPTDLCSPPTSLASDVAN